MEDLPFPEWDLVSFSGTKEDIFRAKALGLDPATNTFDLVTAHSSDCLLLTADCGCPPAGPSSTVLDGVFDELPYYYADEHDVACAEVLTTDVSVLFSASLSAPLLVAAARPPVQAR